MDEFKGTEFEEAELRMSFRWYLKNHGYDLWEIARKSIWTLKEEYPDQYFVWKTCNRLGIK